MFHKTFDSLFLFLALFALPAVGQKPLDALERQVCDYLSTRKAQVGIAVIVNGKDTLYVNNDFRYPMMSVFKFHQALAVADYLRHLHMPLTSAFHIEKEELLPDTYSPLRDKYPNGEIDLSVADLLTYTLQLSDNNACDILFKHTANVKETDAYIRSLGLESFAVGATEADMHRDMGKCMDNWTSPLEMVRLLEIFLTRGIPSEPYHSFIHRTLTECRTGEERLAKPLRGTGAVIGHKTGTGDADTRGLLMGINDAGFVFLPDGQRYVIAVFVTNSEESRSGSEAIIATLSEMVYRWLKHTDNVRSYAE